MDGDNYIPLEINKYSINLMWINKSINPSDRYIMPDIFMQQTESMLDKWCNSNPDADVNLWFDSQYVTP